MASWIITIGILCIITSVIFCKPYLGVAFVILSIPFESIIYFGCISIYPVESILVISCLIYIYKFIVGRENYFISTKLMYCCIPFVLCIMSSAIKSIEFSLTAKEIVRWLELFVIYYITINLINDEKKMRIILYTMFLAMAMVSVLGIIDHLRTGNRAISLFGNSNPLAGYVNLIIPVIFGMMMVKASLRERSILAIIAILSIMVWYFTYSRIAWLSLLLTIVLLFFQTKTKKIALLYPMVFFAILASCFLVSDIRNGFINKARLQNLPHVLEHRATGYVVGYNILKDDPILGIGIGNYHLLVKKFIYSDPLLTESFVYRDNSIMVSHLHSLYLQILVETGLMGLCAFVFWLVCIVKYLVSSLKSLEKSRHYWLLVGLMGGVIVFLFNNLTDVLVVHGIHLQWGIVLGLAVALTQFRESEKCPKAV